jgi:hypothetical protein
MKLADILGRAWIMLAPHQALGSLGKKERVSERGGRQNATIAQLGT